jgi:hypothetical protein
MAVLLWLCQRYRKFPENQKVLGRVGTIAASQSQPRIAAQ